MARFRLINGLVHFELTRDVLVEYPWLCELPEYVAVEGGSARSIARRLITGEYEEVRDIDLVCVEDGADEDTLSSLAEKFMADDYSHGYGIQTVDVGDYFATRDFTLNEVLVVGGEMICTPDAFKAYKLGLITPSANERITSRTQVKAQYLCAMLMVATRRRHTIDKSLLEGAEDCRLFDIALFLNKAMTRGKKVASTFCKNLNKAGMLWINGNPIEVARYCSELTGFEFRNNSYGYEAEDGMEVESFMNFHSADSSIRYAVDEYLNEASVHPDAYTAAEWRQCNE